MKQDLKKVSTHISLFSKVIQLQHINMPKLTHIHIFLFHWPLSHFSSTESALRCLPHLIDLASSFHLPIHPGLGSALQSTG